MATNVQELIQGLAPVTANNGNPNTVYNTPASPFANPTAGMPANWVLGNLPSYKPLDWQKLAAQAPQPLDGFKGFGIHSDAPNTWPGIQPPPTPTPTPPPTGNTPPPNVNTGGPDLPRRNPNLGGGEGGNGGQWWRNPNDPRWRNAYGSGKGYEFADPAMRELWDATFQSQPGNGAVTKGQLLDGMNKLGDWDIPLGELGQQLYGTSLGRAVGVTQDGSIDVAQMVDWFLPGNIYMSQTGQFNFANLIPTLASAVFGPLGGFLVTKLLDHFGAKYENIDDSDLNWLQKIVKHRYQKNKENRQQGRNANRGGGEGGGLRGPSGGMGYRGGTFTGGTYGWDPRTPRVIVGPITRVSPGSGPANLFSNPDINQK